MECRYVFSLAETRHGLVQYRDPHTNQEMRYTRCPKCGHRWYGYRREKRVQGVGFGAGQR